MKVSRSRITLAVLAIFLIGNIYSIHKKKKTTISNSSMNTAIAVDDFSPVKYKKYHFPNINSKWRPSDYKTVADAFSKLPANELPKQNNPYFIHMTTLDGEIFKTTVNYDDKLLLLQSYALPINDINYAYEDGLKKGIPLHNEFAKLNILTTSLVIETIKTADAMLFSIPKTDPQYTQMKSMIQQMKTDLVPTILKSALILSNGKYKFDSATRKLVADNLLLRLPLVWKDLPAGEKGKIYVIIQVTLDSEQDIGVKKKISDLLPKIPLG